MDGDVGGVAKQIDVANRTSVDRQMRSLPEIFVLIAEYVSCDPSVLRSPKR